MKTCNKCGYQNTDDARECVNCLTNIQWAKVNLGNFTGTPEETISIGEYERNRRGVNEFPHSAKTSNADKTSLPILENFPQKNYAVLRGISNLSNVLAWIMMSFFIISGLGGFISITSSMNMFLGLAAFIVAILIGVFFFILLRVVAESISVLLDIEKNTRQTAINTQKGTR